MPLYFAYGANMDIAAMALRCPKSRPLGRGRLARHRFFVMEAGWASVAPDPRATVHGVLWELDFADVPALDRYEDVGSGLYRKIVQPVLREPVGSARALVYIGAQTREGPAQPGYLENVIAAARERRLPTTYVSYLETFLPDRKRDRRP